MPILSVQKKLCTHVGVYGSVYVASRLQRLRIGADFKLSDLDQLRALTSLSWLDLEIELPTEEPTTSVARAVQVFRSLPALTDLRLVSNIWSLAWFSLSALRALRSDTDHCDIDPERPAEFVPLCAQLEHCELSQEGDFPSLLVEIGIDPMVLALALLQHCPQLRSLVLPRHGWTDDVPEPLKLAFLQQGGSFAHGSMGTCSSTVQFCRYKVMACTRCSA